MHPCPICHALCPCSPHADEPICLHPCAKEADPIGYHLVESEPADDGRGERTAIEGALVSTLFPLDKIGA